MNSIKVGAGIKRAFIVVTLTVPVQFLYCPYTNVWNQGFATLQLDSGIEPSGQPTFAEIQFQERKSEDAGKMAASNVPSFGQALSSVEITEDMITKACFKKSRLRTIEKSVCYGILPSCWKLKSNSD